MSSRVSSSVRSAGRDDRVRGVQVLRRELRAAAPDELGHLLEDRVETLLVVCLERLERRLVEAVQLLAEVVVDLVLPFAHQPDDHCSSSFCFSPEPSSPFSFASSSSTWLEVVSSASSRSSCV